MSHDHTSVTPAQPLISDYAGDPDMHEPINLFVNELPARVAALHGAWREQRMPDLQRMAHQLKGAGAGYGFTPITDAASHLEQSLVRLGAARDRAILEQISREIDALVGLCRRAINRK